MDIIETIQNNVDGTVSASNDDRLNSALDDAALEACRLIAPIWPLKDFVAVNPMQGLSATEFAEASGDLRRANGGDLLMPRSFYREAFRNGRFGTDDIKAALSELDITSLGVSDVETGLLTGEKVIDRRIFPTVADTASEVTKQDWAGFVVDQISFWASSYFDQGQALWKNPWRDQTPYRAWRDQARLDRSPEILGLQAFRSAVAILPEDPAELLRTVVERLNIPREIWERYFHRLLSSVSGWAGHLRYKSWERELQGEAPSGLIEMLAIRAAYDLALFDSLKAPELALEWPRALREAQQLLKHEAKPDPVDLVAHRAFERAYQDRLVSDMKEATRVRTLRTVDSRPSVQAVFCIDVRSERFRRALEQTESGIETFGFAGFFGLPIAVQGAGDDVPQAQCPVLLTPQYTVEEVNSGPLSSQEVIRLKDAGLAAWKRFKNAAISSFSFVEALGVGFAAALLRDSALKPVNERQIGQPISLETCTHHHHDHGIAAEDRVALAKGVLAGMSLGDRFGRVVLLAGHGATTNNNPYASGLDCGACGGHAGDSNARAAAMILNDVDVRKALAEDGQPLPDDTVFVAALHDTVTDEVTLLDEETIPVSHAQDLAHLRRNLIDAGRFTRRERAVELGLPDTSDAEASIIERSRDWSQVRPEWGLAGCAAFIAAPRERTRNINLHGRSFLHSYAWQADGENAILELIMTAPLVVASWINLQYFASTVNNEAFGSGDKTLHNVVGGLGVLEGNGGDLRGGLPMQSIHDGEAFYHTPLRLTALIEAPVARIDAVLTKHRHVAELFDNGWLTLIAIEDEGRRYRRYDGNGSWSEADPAAAKLDRKDAA
ncbi:MAG: DUF2309 domain-containing protein [Pseudomonadota bacterium]